MKRKKQSEEDLRELEVWVTKHENIENMKKKLHAFLRLLYMKSKKMEKDRKSRDQ